MLGSTAVHRTLYFGSGRRTDHRVIRYTHVPSEPRSLQKSVACVVNYTLVFEQVRILHPARRLRATQLAALHAHASRNRSLAVELCVEPVFVESGIIQVLIDTL